MNLRLVAFVAIALFGLVMGPATPAVAQDSKVSSTVVERPSINGESTVLLDVENDTVRIDAKTSRRTRREYATDADGRRRLVVTIEENRVDRPDGGQSIVRNFTVPDVNGRPRATRRETEETVPEGGGVFRTLIEVSVPGVNRGRFVSTERVEQTERRDGEQVLEIDRTTYTSQPGFPFCLPWMAPLYTRGPPRPRDFVRRTHRPTPEAVTSARADVRPTGAPAFRAFLRHRSTLVPFLRQAGFVALGRASACRHRQRPDPPQHVAEQPSGQIYPSASRSQ